MQVLQPPSLGQAGSMMDGSLTSASEDIQSKTDVGGKRPIDVLKDELVRIASNVARGRFCKQFLLGLGLDRLICLFLKLYSGARGVSSLLRRNRFTRLKGHSS